ncbi:MAG TPA: phosphatase PAP2 family protein [Bryobacteraceae bacterium]|nr:phosphatase PAP2 family protein [Bryobacteraceae bacterium]
MNRSRAAATLSAPDHFLMRRVNRWRPPRWIRVWMLAATRAGDGWLWWCCGLAVWASHDPANYRALAAAGLAVLAGISNFKILKRAVGRRRPCAIEPHCWANLLPPDQFSFPSGHSITAFAVAVSFGTFYPSAQPVLLFCATSVAASRVLLGMHFLSDVIVGSGIGAVLGYLAALLFMTI